MATSGSFTGARGGSSTGPYLTLSWSRIATDIPNNKSQLRLTLNLVSDYSLSFSASKTGVLEGTSFTYTGGFSGTGTKTLKTMDVWYTHNSDGSLTTTLDATFNIAISWGGATVNSISVSGSATIDTIPRATDITAFSLSNTVLMTDTAFTVNYTLDRKSSSFSQDMTLQLGSIIIKSWNIASTGALTQTISAAEVNSIISNIPTSISGQLTLTCTTKSGSTTIGNYDTAGASFTLSGSVQPSASGLSVSISGSGRDKTLNKYIQNMSKVYANFTSSAGYGASITSNTITVRRQSDGGNSQTMSGTGGTTSNPVSLSGVYEIIATTTDSRNRSISTSTTITVNAYSAPTITSFSASRDSVTTSTVKATINASWSLGTDNPTNISVVGVNNVGTSTTLYTLNGSTAGNINTVQSYTSQSDASSYTYTITVTDSFGNTANATATVATSFVEFTISKGNGVGVAKVWEKGALDVGGPIFATGLNLWGIDSAPNGGQSTPNDNLDTTYIVGRYTFSPSTVGRPLDGYGTVDVVVSSGLQYNGSNNWIWQKAYTTGNPTRVFIRNKVNAGAWSSWIEQTIQSGTNSNGEYIRFGNGHQICYYAIDTSGININSAYGPAYQGIWTWTYPATFVGNPVVSCGMFKYDTGASWGSVSQITTTNADIRGHDFFSRAATAGIYTKVRVMAVGRWY